MKNLIGLVPLTHYRLNSTYTYRSALHGTAQQAPRRIPRTIIDLNRARPIHFALVDGIKTSEGGEGPWISTWNPIAADVLIAGKNPLATDAVSTAVMGFDPTAESLKEAPFLYCENHLQLAYEQGLGTNRLDEIEIVGASLEEVRTEFTPCKRDPDDKRIHHPRGVFAAV